MSPTASGSSSLVAVWKPVNSSIAPPARRPARPAGARRAKVLNTCLGGLRPCPAAAPALPLADPGEIDDHGDALVALAGVPPDVLMHPDHLHPVQTRLVVDQDPSAVGEDDVVGGVSRRPARASATRATSGAGKRSRPAPSAARRGSTWPAARPPSRCPGATRAGTPSTGSGRPRRAAPSAATRTARAPASG